MRTAMVVGMSGHTGKKLIEKLLKNLEKKIVRNNILFSDQSYPTKNWQPVYLKKTITKSNVIQNNKFQTNN
jgi:3-polyprenyl-4-hydroxybenzoate decarboxylase